MKFNHFNQNQDSFDNFLEQFLKKITKLLGTAETRLNPTMPFMQNIPTSSNSIRLDDFLDDIGIALADILNGGVTKISPDTLLIEFPNGDIFRLKLIKDTNFGNGGMGGFFDGFDGFRSRNRFDGFGDLL